jgi:hypothetical protein
MERPILLAFCLAAAGLLEARYRAHEPDWCISGVRGSVRAGIEKRLARRLAVTEKTSLQTPREVYRVEADGGLQR